MTDKQIIINRVDVAECEYLGLYKECKLKCGSCCPVDCSDNPNCHYKLYKRKEQECEEKQKTAQDAINKLCAEKSALHNELDQLKAENIKFTLDTKNLVAQYSAKLKRLKQTLVEIKPVLELYANSKIGEEQLDGTYKIIVEDLKVLGGMYITFDPRPAKQALQKISECEVENAVVSSYYDKSERKEINGNG